MAVSARTQEHDPGQSHVNEVRLRGRLAAIALERTLPPAMWSPPSGSSSIDLLSAQVPLRPRRSTPSIALRSGPMLVADWRG
ncbi:unannotated protein [freshwater metagenome]|uniref:Unannotated protein n=1 Tax=freshwater metagenome TaxID=449393 RepID=A0A6J7RUB8_9ZZZZ